MFVNDPYIHAFVCEINAKYQMTKYKHSKKNDCVKKYKKHYD